jgi:hypothetical protein
MSCLPRRMRALLSIAFVSLLIGGSQHRLVAAEEEENPEERVASSEMLEHRARIEPKTGIILPVNQLFKTAGPGDGASGIKGSFEAVEKGIWFGLEFDYTGMKTEHALGVLNRSEDWMKGFDRFEILASFDYDIVLPFFKNSTYNPILRPGIGAGLAIVSPVNVSPSVLELKDLYQFVGRIALALRWPFHKNIAAFVEGDFDWIPQSKFDVSFKNVSGTQVLGDNVEFSTGNIWFGLSFEW